MSGFISKYSILACSLLFSGSIFAADKKKVEKDVPLYQGLTLGLELAQPLLGLTSISSGYSAKMDVNLKNAYFPTIELGYSDQKKTSDMGNTSSSHGNYIKLGVNKSMAHLGDKAENLFFVGAHYGFTHFKYDINTAYSDDTYWSDNAFSATGFSGSAGWLELAVGVRIKLIGPTAIGWTCQYKSTLHVSENENGSPALIPGYGEYQKPRLGFAVHLYIRL
jgi:hypothetical protein